MKIKSNLGMEIYECGFLYNVEALPELVIAPLTATIVHNSTVYTQEQTTYNVQIITTSDVE